AKFSGNSAPAPANAFLTKSTVSLCGFDFSLSRSLMALTLTAAAVARSSCDQPIDLRAALICLPVIMGCSSRVLGTRHRRRRHLVLALAGSPPRWRRLAPE